MGMLVDNAIVITEGILSGLQKGKSRLKSINDTIAESFWPLLGATLIAILAFLPVYLSPDDTGEYCASLFLVISISLILSWLLAIFQTPVFCDVFLPRSREKTEITTVNKLNQKSPTEKILLHYRNFLEKSIKKPQITAYSVGLVLILSIISFSFVEQIFFPASTRKQFYVDYWLPEGTRIEKTRDDIIRIEQEILSYQEVESISSAVGNSPPRFYISYKPETPNPAYGVIFINVHDHRDIKKLKKRLGTYLQNNFPGASPRVREFVLGVPVDFKSEIRISGQNSETLRKIATEISEKLRRSPFSGEVRHDWREAILAIEPLFSQEKARRSLVSRKDVGDTFKRLNEGVTVGLFREKNRLMPVRIRAASSERKNIENFIDAPVFGSSLNPVPLSQLVTKLNPFFMNSLIIRRNRKRTITVQSDPAPGINAANYLKAIKPLVESVRLPDGYELQWAGEVAESAKASQAVLQFIPPVFFIMCIIIILLFNSLRHLLLLLICLPLALVGVSFGLLLFKQPFGFMAMLGSLSLFGMFIKNAIVLLDQIEIERKEGKEFYESVIEASVSRMRPVIMASLTTILGMLPLAADALYSAMAVAIMSGLLFATLLTLIVVPVLYTKIMK
jgi:multidrug efflux pump subunit AcrB